MVDYCLQDVRILLSAVQVAVREDLNLMEFDGKGRVLHDCFKNNDVFSA